VKFRIRFADQIVGFFIIAAFAALALVIFMLGSKQRWFAKDFYYKTYFDTAQGLGNNMAVQYKGFAIGNVRSFTLAADDRVEVVFSVHDTYRDRVREGSVVDMLVSPIGLGNQFVFYPGLGSPLEEGALVPSVQSAEGQGYIKEGLARVPVQKDSVTVLITRVNTLLDNVNQVALQVEAALAGTEESALGRAVGNVESSVAGFGGLVGRVDRRLDPVLANTAVLIAGAGEAVLSLQGILADLRAVSGDLAQPEGAIRSLLSVEGPLYTNLEAAFKSLSAVLKSLETTAAYLPAQLPQLSSLIAETRQVVHSAEEVMAALKSNPLLKGGVPQPVESGSPGVSPRNIQF